jgi:hypothetical protein
MTMRPLVYVCMDESGCSGIRRCLSGAGTGLLPFASFGVWLLLLQAASLCLVCGMGALVTLWLFC